MNQAALLRRPPAGSLQKERRNPGIVHRFPHFRSEVTHFLSASLSLVRAGDVAQLPAKVCEWDLPRTQLFPERK